ncbi:MAG: hypothetical protein QM804_10335 [Propionicimonas sp.]
MAARKAPAAKAAGAPEPSPAPAEYEVVGDALVCHPYDDLRLSLVVPMPVVERWTEINATAKTWREQIAAWQAEVIPADVLATIKAVTEGDGIAEIALCRQWSDGLDVRLGKALSS